jgi:hypothetical protein
MVDRGDNFAGVFAEIGSDRNRRALVQSDAHQWAGSGASKLRAAKSGTAFTCSRVRPSYKIDQLVDCNAVRKIVAHRRNRHPGIAEDPCTTEFFQVHSLLQDIATNSVRPCSRQLTPTEHRVP